MNINNLIFALFLSIMVASCKNEKEIFSLEAKLTNISEGTLFILKDIDTNAIIDSAYLTNGNLSVKGMLKSEHPEKLLLFATDSISKEFVYTFLLVENEHLTLNADKKDFPWNIDASGSVHQDEAEKFNEILYQKQKIVSELKLTYNKEEQKELLSEKLIKISDSLDNITLNLIKEEFNSYAALDNFKYYKKKFSNEELSILYNTLDVRLKETIAGKAVQLQSEYPEPQIGDMYYDYTAINQQGNTISLSNIKNKYILLHFSSFGCYGSQLSLPDLKEMYDTYGDQLEVVSISEDFNKEQWQNHVKRDSITWTYLWDGKGDFGDAVTKYWETGTPNYVLISPDKIILEKWFGYTEGLLKEKIAPHLIE